MKIAMAIVKAVQDVILVIDNLEFNEFELKLKEYAKQYNVPIIQDGGLALLEEVIALLKPKKILEIGTAIGYSAIRMNRLILSKEI